MGFRETGGRVLSEAGSVTFRSGWSSISGCGKIVYRVHRLACNRCPNHGSLCKAKRPSTTRSLDQDLYNLVERHLSSPSAKRSIRQRQDWPETVFAEMKQGRGLNRASLKGKNKVWIQALMAFAAHNILQLAKACMAPLQAAAMTVSRLCAGNPLLSAALAYTC